MKERKYLVRWQDGSYDPYSDNYREIKSKKAYSEWIEDKTGTEGTEDEARFAGPVSANPDQVAEEQNPWFGGEAFPPMELALMNKAVAKLTPKQRQVWELTYVRQKTQAEISDILGIKQQSVSELAAKALKNVRKAMGISQ